MKLSSFVLVAVVCFSSAAIAVTEQCTLCVTQSCTVPLIACQADPACVAFGSCWTACTDGDCIQSCATANPSAETDAVLACMIASCESPCFFPPSVPGLDAPLSWLLAALILGSGFALFAYVRSPSS